MIKKLITPLVILSTTLGIATNCFAFQAEVHETDTYNWAKELGIDNYTAAAIANADNWVDTAYYLSTERHLDRQLISYLPDSRRQIWTDEMSYAKQLYSSGQTNAAWSAIGRGLHSMQDKYAHFNAGIKKGEIKSGSSHGMTYNNGAAITFSYNGSTWSLEGSDVLDNPRWDNHTADAYNTGAWHYHSDKTSSKRWLDCKTASQNYMAQFIRYTVYGY